MSCVRGSVDYKDLMMSSLIENLLDHKNSTYLTDCVSVVPCMCSYNATEAIERFGFMLGNSCSKKGECLPCKTIVTSYYPNPHIKKLATVLSCSKGPSPYSQYFNFIMVGQTVFRFFCKNHVYIYMDAILNIKQT